MGELCHSNFIERVLQMYFMIRELLCLNDWHLPLLFLAEETRAFGVGVCVILMGILLYQLHCK